MNIFCTDEEPFRSAQNLDDRRVIKMVVESGQMLSTALRVHGYEGDDIYRSAYLNHPCTRWARGSSGNFLWLLIHAMSLCEIYTSVYNREHKTEGVIRHCIGLMDLIPKGHMYPFANCSLFKDEPDTIKAYQDTMNIKWKNDNQRPTWHNRVKPSWYVNLG